MALDEYTVPRAEKLKRTHITISDGTLERFMWKMRHFRHKPLQDGWLGGICRNPEKRRDIFKYFQVIY